MKRLDDISSILDEHIEKGMKLERSSSRTRVDQIEEEISKSLSFNPFEPVMMNEGSRYYNPYAMHPAGGFMPYPESYWAEQGESVNIGGQTYSRPRGPGGYETVREFYRVTGDDPMDARPQVQLQSTSQFARFSKSCTDFIFKGKPVPVGTIHVGPDGTKYKKMQEGRWVPVATKDQNKFRAKMLDPKKAHEGAMELEDTAGRRLEIEGIIQHKTREKKTIEEAKNQAVRAAAQHAHNMMTSLYDGPPPKEVQEAHKQHLKQHGEPHNSNPRKLLHQISHASKPKQHAVEVHFKYNGQEYKHRFPQVESQNHGEAIERVSELLNQKLPGAQVSKIHAETPKENKPDKKKPAK